MVDEVVLAETAGMVPDFAHPKKGQSLGENRLWLAMSETPLYADLLASLGNSQKWIVGSWVPALLNGDVV